MPGSSPSTGAISFPISAQPAPTKLASNQLPAWRQAMAANTWAVIPASNTLSTIDPAKTLAHNPNHPAGAPWRGSGGQAAAVYAWCGAILDETTDTFWLPIGGGHGDYGGNEPYRIRLDVAAPVWQMVRPPTGSLQSQPLVAVLDDGQENSGTYADGRIRAIHSYNKAVYVPGIGPFLAHNGGGFANGNGSGEPNKRTFVMNESSGEWVQVGSHGNAYVPASGSGCTYDPSRHVVWYQVEGDSPIRKYSFVTQQWTTQGSAHGYNGYVALTYIAALDVIVSNLSLGGFSGPVLQVFDPVTNLWTQPPVQGTPPAGLVWNGQAQARWVPSLGALCFWNHSSNTSTIGTLTPGTNPRTSPWTWGSLLVAAGNSVVPTTKGNNQGTYGRFAYSPRLDGFYLFNAVDQPIYFFALS